MLRVKINKLAVEQLNNKNKNNLLFGVALIITILVVWVFILLTQKNSLETLYIETKKNLDLEYQNTKYLQKKLLKIKQELNSKGVEIIVDINETIEPAKIEEPKKVQYQEPTPKKVILVLPDEEKNYKSVIPKLEYKDIKLDDTKNVKKDDIKISPEVFINKDDKKLEGAKIQIETKF